MRNLPSTGTSGEIDCVSREQPLDDTWLRAVVVFLTFLPKPPRYKICSMTSIFEGNIIRHIRRRLEELLRQMSCASKATGNTTLEAKFNEGN